MADHSIEILIFFIIPLTIGIVSVRRIQHMIRLYQYQSIFLAAWTILRGFQQDSTPLILIPFALLIPIMLSFLIQPLLAQATVPRPSIWYTRLWQTFLSALPPYRQEASRSIQAASVIWDEHDLGLRQRATSIVVSLFLTLFAYLVAVHVTGEESWNNRIPAILAILILFNAARLLASMQMTFIIVGLAYLAVIGQADPGQLGETQSLAASLTLLLLGIFTMITRNDLISQIIGLLVMDHGLFLAAVRLIEHPDLLFLVVGGLFFYILITLLILVILLPELLLESGTIEVGSQRVLRG